MLKVRFSTKDDAYKIGQINVNTWKVAYKGILPDDFLDKRNLTQERVQKIEQRMDKDGLISLVVEYNQEVIGFCAGGFARDNDYPFLYELYAIYVLPEYQKMGAGQKLFEAFKKQIKGKPFYLYALKENINAIRFYVKNGGKELPCYEKKLPINGINTNEILFAFEN